MKSAAIVFPHQLFESSPLIKTCKTFYLVEEWLYFSQYNFHKQKIAYHRASMKWYADFLHDKNKKIIYIDAIEKIADIRNLIPSLHKSGLEELHYIETTDNWLDKRLRTACKKSGIELVQHPQQLFINSIEELEDFFGKKARFFQADFYTHQRISKKLLLEKNNKPLGGKWSLDAENRLRFPKDQQPPAISFHSRNEHYNEAISYTEKHFAKNYGNLNVQFLFPSTHTESKTWLKNFLKKRFEDFGPYEDAIVAGEHILHHSVLTPMLNTGLLSPEFVLAEVLEHASGNAIPLNSLEGFIRQLIGWREYIRAVYEFKGVEERTKNFWGFKRKIPASFWTGTTGIDPVDGTIRKVLDTAYTHHIERLMILGNFMLLCEFDPDEVYKWFMELFIDAYDWVMVPNVYGMSQFADGGLMSTKPYISGSNYILKMSDYKKGDWQEIWDALFWRFLHVHTNFFKTNPRLGMLVKTFDKMPADKKKSLLTTADNFLNSLEN